MNQRPIYIPFAGPALLEAPLLNKGGAFSREERQQFNLEGLLPHKIETIEEQLLRARVQLDALKTDIDKHVYLRDLQDTNETLYFRFVIENLEEIMPLIYTPTVGQACQLFSIIYRRKRGVFVSYNDRDRIDEMLQNATKKNVKVIVVTDSERILGLGDQGIGGMGIPIGKLALYTACGGISPAYTLPITLDVGTNNQTLINDPMYLGLKHPRITGNDYVEFVDTFIKAVKRRWPHAIVQFEDFAQSTATPLLARYQDKLCCFNDDIQGTAAVTVGTLLTACLQKNQQLKEQKLKDQIVALVGSGSAGCGIAEQIVAQMQDEGLSETEARQRIFMLNSKGLLLDNAEGIRDFQQTLCQSASLLNTWQLENSSSKTATLSDVVNNAKPTILIGVSGQPGIFTEKLIRTMNTYCEQPIIFPLSNPTSQVEALPSDLIEWTQGRAIIATGSPFEPVNYQGKQHIIAQCNNSYIFPGLGLGAIAANATRITNNMMMTSSRALAMYSQNDNGDSGLLPPLSKIRDVSKVIAKAVFKQAIADGVALNVPDDIIDKEIEKNFWYPEYRTYKRTSF
jgi:malate dehydrogenase (oxaloacetate-decarboxylating)